MTRITALLLTITLLGTAAGAGDLETCESGKDNRKGIAACTRLLDAGVHTFEERASTFVYRGKRYSDIKDYKRAIKDFNAAIDLFDTYAAAYMYRGWAYALQGNKGRAVRDLTKSIRHNDGRALTYGYRGTVYMDQKKWEKALKDGETALELEPDYNYARLITATSLEFLGRFDKANVHLDTYMSNVTAENVRDYQEKLTEFGHYTGPIHGRYDKATRAASHACTIDPKC